jgi:hypothetical protein
MSFANYETNDYIYDLSVLIISHLLHVSLSNEKWVQLGKYPRNNYLIRDNFFSLALMQNTSLHLNHMAREHVHFVMTWIPTFVSFHC